MPLTEFKTDVSLIKSYAENRGFFYYLARTSGDFINLVDEPHEGLYFFHAQDRVQNNTSDTGGFISNTYTGMFWIAKVSNLDGVVNNDKFIEVERILALNIAKDFKKFFCRNHVVKVSNGRPFYNLFSTNYDGVMYDYSIEVTDIFNLDAEIADNYIRNGEFKPTD